VSKSGDNKEMSAKRLIDDHGLPTELAAAWRADARQRSERPEQFWRAQQVRIGVRIESGNVRRPRRLWLVAVTATLIFFAVLLIAPAGPRPLQVPPQARIDADQELLLAVERALASGTPEALEPLTLLIESSSTHNDVETISHKEHGNEN
jgi:hypothetical protein